MISRTRELIKKFEIPKDELTRQVEEIFSEVDMESLLYEGTSKCHTSIKSKDIISGKVISIRSDSVLIDYGGKSEAKLSYYEDGNVNDDLDVGDETKFLVTNVSDGGYLSLSRKNVSLLIKQREVLASLEEGKKVVGKLIHHTKNGWLVNINGLPALLPTQQEYLVYPKEGPEGLIDAEIDAEIESIEEMMVILTRKSFASEVKKKAKETFFTSLAVGDLVEGMIKNITEFGAFIQIASGIIGLCHTSDFGEDSLKVGVKTKSRVLKIDREKNRISLGIRQVTEPSWEELVGKYSIGDRVMAEVKSIVPYGAFLQIEAGVSGLVHVSDLSWSEHIKHPKEIISAGETIEVVVLGVDVEKQHLSLGLKQVSEDPWETISDRYLPGHMYEGRITNKTKFGIFVELERGVEGLAHHTIDSKNLKIGELVTVSVLRIDTSRKKVSLALEE
jgi:small subunit ribosomal protein S1